jgi:Lhr-like helicase
MKNEVELKNLINEVVNYLIIDEEKHYTESDKPGDHIYLKLLRLKELLLPENNLD